MLGARELLASILIRSQDAIPEDSTPLVEIDDWDSLRHVLLILELEKELDTQLTAEQIEAIVTIADVDAALESKTLDG